MKGDNCILVVNAGSSSIKIKAYREFDSQEAVLEMGIEKAGLPGSIYSFSGQDMANKTEQLETLDYNDAVQKIVDELRHTEFGVPVAIGHRIVHGGGRFNQPTVIDGDVLMDLKQLYDIDPEHMPATVKLIEALQYAFPGVPHVGTFDTSFYADLPRVAQMLAIPRKYEAMGMRRYGFHGISYTYLLEKLTESCGQDAANGRVILAHLGSGASLSAVHHMKPVDTTMGMTPASGIPMSTRSGDVDPGIFWQLHNQAGLEYGQINALLSHESGLLGISETTADMYWLLENQGNDVRAAEAVELFCYQVKKAIGSLAAVLGGVDTIVFSGGMGENAPRIRERVLRGLEFLGVELHDERNYAGMECISSDASRVGVHVFHTDESSVIVRQVMQTLQFQGSN